MGVSLAGIRAMLAGDELHGVCGDQFDEAVRSLPLERKRTLHIGRWDLSRTWEAKDEAAHQQDAAEKAARIAAALDRGRRPEEDLGPNAPQPRAEAVAREISARAGEFGLRSATGEPVSASYVLGEVRRQAHVLGEQLQADCRRLGEPKPLQELRRELSRAKASLWERQRAHEEQQQRFRAIRDAEAERDVMAAHAKAIEAAAVVNLLRERLAREWAVVA